MKKIKYTFLLLLISCTTSKVVIDYDSKIDLNQFKTYGFYEDAGAGLNELDVKRVINSIDLEMKKLGFKKTEIPDFYINLISRVSENRNNNTIGIGIGGGGRNGGFGISGGIPIGGKKLNEEITVEFVDSKTDKLFWQGILNSTIKEKRNPQERKAYFNQVINKILKEYPLKEK